MMRFGVFLALCGVVSPSAFATANNCGTPAGTSPTYTNPGTAIAETAANNVLGAGLGCETINLIFDNFAANTTGGGPDAGELRILGTLQTGTVTNPNMVRMQFTDSTGDWSNNSGGNRVTTINFDVTVDATVLSAARLWGVTGSFTYSSFGGSDDITITTRICSAVGGDGICNANAGDVVVGTITRSLGAGDAAAGTVTLTGLSLSGLSTIFVNTIATLVDGTGSGINLTNFSLDFYETPEPSTFGLMGTALLTLGAMARRRRRRT